MGGPKSVSIQMQVEMQIQHTPKSGLIARARLSLSNPPIRPPSVSFSRNEAVSLASLVLSTASTVRQKISSG